MGFYTRKDYDKFTEKTSVRNSEPVTLFSNKASNTTKNLAKAFTGDSFGPMTNNTIYQASFRHVSHPSGDHILLDVDYTGENMVMLKDGYMVLHLNGVTNIRLTPVLNDLSFINALESVYYELSEAEFKAICDASTVEFKIMGSHGGKVGECIDLKYAAQAVYGAVYDANKYSEELTEASAEPSAKWPGYLSLVIGVLLTLIAFISVCDEYNHARGNWFIGLFIGLCLLVFGFFKIKD